MRARTYRWIGALMMGLTLHTLIFYVVLEEESLALTVANFVSFMLIVIGAGLIGWEDRGKKSEDSASAH